MPTAREGESTREGSPPLVRGLGVPPREFFLNFLRFYVRFNGFFFMRLGPDFCHDCLLEKIFHGA